MKKDIEQFTERKAQVVVIAPHQKAKVKTYWEKENLPFIGIPDPDGILGKLYGQEWNLIKMGRMPALFIIDKKGIVVFAQYARSMADIPENSGLFQIIERTI
ncbi:MAG TPA: redoxin domain-containing protein [Deltaproteobacteria bacterium]|nr:redoxin domain-containing protein [Deltaproteobacteria bacterium]